MSKFVTTSLYLAVAVMSGLTMPTAFAGDTAPVIQTESGRVSGVSSAGVDSWKGIPFAAPPIGQNRWRAPQPAVHWSDIRMTKDFGPDCMQKPFPSDAAPLGTTPSEDCLLLNVWRPAGSSAQAKLPVMVWIYGGGYVNGGAYPAIYSGEKFARQGILFVSFNYRLGRFGFFAHPALAAAKEGPVGNFAYMDQLAALQWVKHNIAQFGGDPENVTLVGESAGGASTLTMLTTPEARGLLHRAIVMSGGGRAPWSLRPMTGDKPDLPSAETVGLNFAHNVGVDGQGPEALAQLRALPAEKVLQGLSMADLFGAKGPVTYSGPIMDGRFVTAAPNILIRSGQWAKVPVMIGVTSADGFGLQKDKAAIFESFGKGAEQARALYDPDGSKDYMALLYAVAADRFAEPGREVARAVSAAGYPAYYYRFGYMAESREAEWKIGAPHATDIPWAFDTADVAYGKRYGARDRHAAANWNGYFVNFIKTGNPNGHGAAAWPAYTQGNESVMEMDVRSDVEARRDPAKARLDLLEALLPDAER